MREMTFSAAQFSALARPFEDTEALMRLRRLAALDEPESGRPLAEELAKMLRGEPQRLDILGIRRIASKDSDYTAFRRNHDWLDDVLQDASESRREWEKSFLRTSGCYRYLSGDHGKVVMAPSIYVWMALALHQASIAPGPEGF